MLQEEEDLVNAHRKQVEETMNIVREVCGLAKALLIHLIIIIIIFVLLACFCESWALKIKHVQELTYKCYFQICRR